MVGDSCAWLEMTFRVVCLLELPFVSELHIPPDALMIPEETTNQTDPM